MICGATNNGMFFNLDSFLFQCRTQHDMWCNNNYAVIFTLCEGFNAARSMICGATHREGSYSRRPLGFNAARSMICGATSLLRNVKGSELCFNAARSMICGATPSLTALVPRRARGHFGKSSIFLPFFPYGAAFLPKNHGVNRRIPLCGAELRPNGKWRR